MGRSETAEVGEEVREVKLEGSERHPAETEGEGCDRKHTGFEDSERKDRMGRVLGIDEEEGEDEDTEDEDDGGSVRFLGPAVGGSKTVSCQRRAGRKRQKKAERRNIYLIPQNTITSPTTPNTLPTKSNSRNPSPFP